MITINSIKAEDTWPIRHKVMWPNESLEFVKLAEDMRGLHFGLFENDRLVSVVSLFITDSEAQFRKLATLVAHQGKGYGSALINHILEESKALNISRIWCNARLDKTSFYHKFDLKETAHSFVKNGQSYVVMEKLTEL
ncbi:GNAT family N-acetyltransferase [Roseivirga sp.]|uniref:GNAT family N-acetyltransferase n=1 Tax=Roseivirga sp. TaxID=1964215 RepID=UPI003B8B946E